MPRRVVALVVFALGATLACAREPLDWVCPEVAEGELALTELRGSQSGADTYGEYIELANLSGRTLDLRGLTILLYKLDGSSDSRIMVRQPLEAAASAYVVFGRADPGALPENVDYGYLVDFDSALYDSGAMEVWACGVLADRVVYRDLPSQGSYAFDGALPPDAVDNDVEGNWCTDAAPDPTPPVGAAGLPGTPGEGNRPCSP